MAGSKRKNKKRKTHKKILLLVEVIVLMFLISELIVFRYIVPLEEEKFALAPRNKDSFILKSNNIILGYEGMPNYEYTTSANITNKFNNDGLRDTEYEVEKEDGVFRVIVLGDSVSMCGGSFKLDECYHSVLERQLADNAVEIISFGQDGYGTMQEIELLKEKGLKYDPDLVILQYTLNDPIMTDTPYRHLHTQKEFDARERHISYKSSFLCGLGHDIGRLKTVRTFSNIQYETGLRVVDGVEKAQQMHSNSCSWKRIEDSFSELRELSEKNDFDVLVIIFPLVLDYDDYPLTEVHEQVLNEAEENDFFSLDILDVYKEYHYMSLKYDYLDIVHSNQKAHRLAAEKIYKYLMDSKIVE